MLPTLLDLDPTLFTWTD